MKFKVDGWNNFCRVFECPKEYSSQFCFGGGIPTQFRMVDWFNPVMNLPQPACSKRVWRENVGEIKILDLSYDDIHRDIIPFIEQKKYIRKDHEYIVVFDFGASVLINHQSHDDSKWE